MELSAPSLHSLGSGRVQAFETSVFTQLCCCLFLGSYKTVCIVHKVIYLKVFSVAEENSLSVKGTSSLAKDQVGSQYSWCITTALSCSFREHSTFFWSLQALG